MPIPPPISSHSFRCLGLALNRRGNHTNGTDTVRPSSRVTVSSWFVHDTSTARTSLLSAKVGIPPLQEPISILQNQVLNLQPKLLATIVIVRCPFSRGRRLLAP